MRADRINPKRDGAPKYSSANVAVAMASAMPDSASNKEDLSTNTKSPGPKVGVLRTQRSKSDLSCICAFRE